MNCDNCGNALSENEQKFYEGLPDQQGALGEVLCDRCAGGSSVDSMASGFLGWKEPSAKENNNGRA